MSSRLARRTPGSISFPSKPLMRSSGTGSSHWEGRLTPLESRPTCGVGPPRLAGLRPNCLFVRTTPRRKYIGVLYGWTARCPQLRALRKRPSASVPPRAPEPDTILLCCGCYPCISLCPPWVLDGITLGRPSTPHAVRAYNSPPCG